MRTARILVVDDEPDMELLIKQRFRDNVRKGEFEFSFASDGQQALDKLAAGNPIDLMLLDINMPVMDGLSVLAHLRERNEAVKAIVVSAYGDMANIRAAMNCGAFDFVTKPIDMADLEITIRKATKEIFEHRETEQRRISSERARHNLARYFSPSMVNVLAERDDPLGPVRRENVAVLFVDIVGFTSISEQMPPETVVEMLTQFVERMSHQVFACGGTIDKFAGDALLATFGVPTPSDHDAHNALRCANMMNLALDQWNLERRAAGQRPISIGVGLNYGPVVMGEIGSVGCMSFTVIGDTVNTASRLQALTRRFNARLLVSDVLISTIKNQPHADLSELVERLTYLGEQDLRGRTQPMRVWMDPYLSLAVDRSDIAGE